MDETVQKKKKKKSSVFIRNEQLVVSEHVGYVKFKERVEQIHNTECAEYLQIPICTQEKSIWTG